MWRTIYLPHKARSLLVDSHSRCKWRPREGENPVALLSSLYLEACVLSCPKHYVLPLGRRLWTQTHSHANRSDTVSRLEMLCVIWWNAGAWTWSVVAPDHAAREGFCSFADQKGENAFLVKKGRKITKFRSELSSSGWLLLFKYTQISLALCVNQEGQIRYCNLSLNYSCVYKWVWIQVSNPILFSRWSFTIWSKCKSKMECHVFWREKQNFIFQVGHEILHFCLSFTFYSTSLSIKEIF